MFRLIAVIVAALFLTTTAYAQASAQGDRDGVEAALVRAMRLEGDQRMGDSGEAIRAYAKAGYVSLKPDQRADYTDYRVLRRPAMLFGQELLVIEEEYMRKYIGCCVSPGVGAILRVTTDIAPLKKFAASNGCSVQEGQDVVQTLQSLGLKPTRGDVLSISCRERDQREK